MPLWTGQPLAYPTVQKTGAAAKVNIIILGVTAFFAFIAASAAAVSAVFLYGQLIDAREAIALQHADTTNLLIASNRPWIKVKEEIGSGLTFDEAGAHIAIKFDVYNGGHSPATDVSAEVKLLPCTYDGLMTCGWNWSAYPTYLAQFCGEEASAAQQLRKFRSEPVAANPSYLMGIAVFPKAHDVIEREAFLSIKNTERPMFQPFTMA